MTAILGNFATPIRAQPQQFNGHPIIYQQVPDVAVAWFLMTPQRPMQVIYVNPFVARLYPQEFMLFTLAHESAHIENGDLNQRAMAFSPSMMLQFKKMRRIMRTTQLLYTGWNTIATSWTSPLR